MRPYIPNCAVPLLFEGEYEEARYGTAGTGFLLSWNNSLFFITAGHCLQLGDHNRLRVTASFASSEVLVLKIYGKTSLPDHEADTDHADFAIFSVEPFDFGPRNDQNLEPVVLPNSDTSQLLNPKIPLTVRGYPASAPEYGIDYERKKIRIQALVCDARFLGAAESKHCHILQFVEDCPVDDFNHMSGSPVFAKCLHEGEPFYILTGLLLRASGKDRMGRFVSIECIKEGLRRFERDDGPR